MSDNPPKRFSGLVRWKPATKVSAPTVFLPGLSDDTGTGLAAMMATVQKVAKAVDRALAPDGILLKQYNRAPAGQSIFHVHFHIVPRWQDVGLSPHGKVMVEARVLEPVAAKIRSALS